MSYDRRVDAYQNALALNQSMLDETFKGGETSINTIGILTKIVGLTTYTFRFSDRAKFVGDDYYHGRAKFPDMKRTVGELVSPSMQFSEMEVQLNNVDGFYSDYLSSGSEYFTFIGSRIVIKVGLGETASTYFTIFDGIVPDEDGYSIDREVITIRARDNADRLNRSTGLPPINPTDFPSAPSESLGKIIPFALGDWTSGYAVDVSTGAVSVTILGVQYNVLTDSPNNFYGGLIGYPVGAGFFVFSIGSYTPETIQNCHIRRGNNLLQVLFVATPQNAAGYWVVQVTDCNLVGGGTIPYIFQDGDIATVSVKIPYAAGQYSNAVLIAKEILKTVGDVQEAELDSASWTSLATKAAPAQSAITAIKARIWIGKKDDKIIEVVLGLLEQVRIEMFWDRAQKIALRSIHPEDFQYQGSTRIEQIHIDEKSLNVKSDQRNFFNKAFANYGYTPILDKTQISTVTRKNQSSVDKTGKTIEKAIDLPALHVEADALSQLDEFIRFYSCGQQYVEARIAWTALLKDLAEIVKVTYRIGSISFDNIPMKVRDITFMPSTGCLNFRLLSFDNFPYDGNELPYESKMLSSQSQTITDA